MTFQASHIHLLLDRLSGVPHEVLQSGYWVPGAVERKEVERYRGKDAFQQMLSTTEQTCLAYFSRAIEEML